MVMMVQVVLQRFGAGAGAGAGAGRLASRIVRGFGLGRGRGRRPALVGLVLGLGLLLGLLAAFPLHSAVLEPNLDLRLGEHEAGGHLEALGSGQVLVLTELFLQLQQLLARERRAWSPRLAEQRMLRSASCNKMQRDTGLLFVTFRATNVKLTNCSLHHRK